MNTRHCQVCHTSHLKLVYQFQQYELVNYADSLEKEFCDLKLLYCEQCSHLQIFSDLALDRKSLFSTGETRTMRSFLRDLSAKIEKRFHLKSKDVVLDIGSNDGTFLRTYDISGLTLVGVEKADELIDEAKTGLDYFIHGDWSGRNFEKVVGQKAKIITALHILEQVKEPLPFLRDVEANLRDDGIFILQVPSLLDILEHNEVEAISPMNCHVYSLKSLMMLLRDAQLEIFDLERVVVGGCALRLYCRKKNSYVENENGTQMIADYCGHEKKEVNFESLTQFIEKIQIEKVKLDEFLAHAKLQEKSIWIYGSNEKSESLFNFLKVKKENFTGIFEFHEKRIGLIHSFLELPVYGEEQLKLEKPDYFLVLSYHFINEYYQREVDWRAAGTTFVLPLPEFRVLS